MLSKQFSIFLLCRVFYPWLILFWLDFDFLDLHHASMLFLSTQMYSVWIYETYDTRFTCGVAKMHNLIFKNTCMLDKSAYII